MTQGPFADCQDEVYLKGLPGEQPPPPSGEPVTGRATVREPSPASRVRT